MDEQQDQGILKRAVSRRRILQVGAGASVAGFIAACSPSSSPSPAASASAAASAAPAATDTPAASAAAPSASAAASAPASAAASAAPNYAGITIKANVGSSAKPILEKLGPDWEALTGGKLQVDFTAFPERALKMASIIATQDPTYDVLYTWEGYMQKFGKQLYTPIQPLIGDTSDFVPGELATLTRDGTLYAVPYMTYVWFLLYNKQMYKDAGLDPEKPPTTWDEAYANAAALTKGKVYPFSAGWLSGPFFAYTYFLMWMNSTATPLISDDQTQVTFANDDGLAAFKSIYDGYKAGFFDPAGMTAASDLDTATIFKQGGTAQIFGGPDVWSQIMTGDAAAGVKIKPEDVGVALVPGITAGTSGTINGFEGFALNKYAQQDKQAEAALHFIQFMTGPDEQKKQMLTLGGDSLPSSRISVLNDPSVQSQYAIGPILAKQGAANSKRYSAPYDITPAFDTAIRNMFKGTWTPDQAHQECVKACQDIIAKYLSS